MQIKALKFASVLVLFFSLGAKAMADFVEESSECASRWTKIIDLVGKDETAIERKNLVEITQLLPSQAELDRTCTEYGQGFLKLQDAKAKILKEYARQTDVVVPFLIRLYPSAETESRAELCKNLKSFVQKDLEALLSGLDKNRTHFTDLGCVFNKSKANARSLKKIDNPELIAIRDEALKATQKH